MRTVIYTHKGWFLLCPIYLGDIDSDAPEVIPRDWMLGILFAISEFLFACYVGAVELIKPDFEPMFPMVITGQLKEPLTLSFFP
ncbi:MAG: hypothetical protein D3M94_07165 [Rhodocyclales bacterium GT-UBC]|nr:MAG: hypothetical protein D3M94_07165 [Rhodocyclales bacterium GT-UBC]